MIKDSIEYCDQYYSLGSGISKGLKYLSEANFDLLEDGKYVISEDIYVNVQSYTTKVDADYEAHRDYIDIQYIISGFEKIGVEGYNCCKSKISYNKESDIEFLTGNGEYVELYSREFMILYPSDAHKPSISISVPTKVRKAVVKVHI